MLERGFRLTAAFISGSHCKSFQSLLVLWLALGCSTETRLRASSDPSYGQIPLTFIANRGQIHHSVRFTAKGPGLTAYFTPGEVVVDLRGSTIRMRYVGANQSPAVDGLQLQEGHANFLIGNDPSEWRTNVPLYGSVAYKSLYPGVDMIYSSHKRLLKSEFVVAPGADASRIQIEYTGVESLRLDDSGGLVFKTEAGELREEAPEIYQESVTGREIVKGAFRVSGNIVSFFVEEYDRSRPLRIDPVLSYSTYLGGSGAERAHAIAVDSSGAAYVTGYTDSTNFPVTAGALQTTFGGSLDAFVTKLNAAGSAIVYSTYLGGSGEDRGLSIAVNTLGNAYITGYTTSSDFPTAVPVQGSNGGSRDAFATELNVAGTAPVYSTYLGGSGNDSGNGIAIDSAGSAYITGSTSSANFPVVGPFQPALAGGQDGFVTKLNATGTAIIYSTYLGGSLDDRGSAIAVDSSGAAYVAGNTFSTNFPTVSPLQAAIGGAQDAFVTKLNASGASLAYSTYLGGSGTENVEVGRSIVVDSSNNAYVTGNTSSVNFPVFQPMQPANNGGGNDAFILKLTAAGTAFVYSTYLGGASMDFGTSVAVDSSGSAYIGGYTASPDFPTVSASQGANGGNYDAFVTKLNASGSALAESGFLGGSGADAGYGIAIDSSGNAYLTGQTFSANFPLLGAIQTSSGSTLAAFVARFTFGASLPPTPVSATPSGTGTTQTFTLVYSDPRGYTNISWVEMNWNATQATTNACYLHYDVASNVIQLGTDAGGGWVGSAPLGVAGTLENSQCSVSTGTSSVSGSGNNLTINLVLTFKQAFAGSKNIYMQVQNASALLTPWQSKGTWTVPTVASGNVSVSPASGTGSVQSFSFVYSDAGGYANIEYAYVLFQSALTGQNACFVQYAAAGNSIWLISDSGSGYLGPLTIGTTGTLTNSQCTINAATSSVSGSGANLTLNLALTFKPAFAGSKNIYMAVSNLAKVFSGWQAKGVWTVNGTLPPTNVSVTPSSGSALTQSFTLAYSNPAGYLDIAYASVLFQTSLVTQNACFLQYSASLNRIYLRVDADGGASVTATPGSSGTLNNSQCTVDIASFTASGSGNNLTLTVVITFKPVFSGAKIVYMASVSSTVFSGWEAKGAWTVPATGSVAPATVSVAPASGSAFTQSFSLVYSDQYGYMDIAYASVLFKSTLSTQSACYLQYSPALNLIYLHNDADSGTTSARLGTAGTLNNSQCALDLTASSISGAGNNLTLNLLLTFKPAFNGAKNTYMAAFSNSNVFSGWVVKGVWTVPVTGSVAPATVSVTPSSGSASAQTFSLAYSDQYGYLDIAYASVLIRSTFGTQNACFVQYSPVLNTLYLHNDGDTVSTPATLGTAGSLSNSQCSLNVGASTVSGSGNNLTLNVVLTFTPAFAGTKSVYMAAINNSNVFSGWAAKGAWTAP